MAEILSMILDFLQTITKILSSFTDLNKALKAFKGDAE